MKDLTPNLASCQLVIFFFFFFFSGRVTWAQIIRSSHDNKTKLEALPETLLPCIERGKRSRGRKESYALPSRTAIE